MLKYISLIKDVSVLGLSVPPMTCQQLPFAVHTYFSKLCLELFHLQFDLTTAVQAVGGCSILFVHCIRQHFTSSLVSPY